MSKIKYILAVVAAVCASLVASPAHAGWPGGEIVHASDDSGYNPPIHILCDSGLQTSLGLGVWSKQVGGCSDVNYIYVGAGDHIRCQTPFFTWNTYDATGWHGISNNSGRLYCYQQKD